MIVLDTNVLSETMRGAPDPNVKAWLNRQDMVTLWLTTITVAELRFGVAKCPHGKKRDVLNQAVETFVTKVFPGRIAAFDLDTTAIFADRLAAASASGREVRGFADAAIAAIALARGFSVATRDTGPFEAMGVRVIDPWKEGTTP